ncbi:ligand-effect modulator 3 family [Diplogelasinospora grovesii]|uniref:Ligand-effect modulator 3 family n=1 Tax=Diplogelasinospora grovesii TaxID=303347 RepID=A0AAN6S9F4_9PEZI|nr:ligand-effect modulator 3 family [Diplogelasinospora grovesii]
MAPRRRRGANGDGSNNDEHSDTDNAPKNRPPNTAFRQQRMKAWQCVLTPKLIVTIFSILAAIYLGFGAYLTYLAHTIRDLRLDYTDCVRDAPNDKFGPVPSENIQAHFSNSANSTLNPLSAMWQVTQREIQYGNYTANRSVCLVQVNIPEDLEPTVSFYYYLENFYQNHRRYVQSFNAKQLLGDAVDGSVINGSNCDPLAYDPAGSGKVIYPCGTVANSMFNDTFSNPVLLNVPGSSNETRTYEMANNTGITWPGIKDLYGKTKYSLDKIVPPPNWRERFRYGYTDQNPPPDLAEWEAFQNWMMLAAAPNFYKLYQKNDSGTMLAGTYQIDIVSNFDTTVYNGRKAFVITTVSPMGARNIWPGIIFLIVGGICLILDIYFVLSFFLWKPRKLGDPSYLSWNQPTPAAAAQTHAAGLS